MLVCRVSGLTSAARGGEQHTQTEGPGAALYIHLFFFGLLPKRRRHLGFCTAAEAASLITAAIKFALSDFFPHLQ